MTTDINIFISHCHTNDEDQKFFNDILMFINPAINSMDNVKLWSDKQLLTGQNIDIEVENALNDMNLMICLVSPEYLNSNYCIEKELKDALAKRKIGKANIFPVILRKCVWKHTFFGQILCQPKDGKPLKEWTDKDEVLSDVTDALMDVIQYLKKQQISEKKN
ncbi:MAG: toll/interleukin-1 receptor domain-containing protein [Acinetobacter sp.]|nr:toll/interleukin-1 receptor domain-containing protein [Acinetobacter sp.]